MALIDEVVIRVFAGAGGNGCVSFRREKYVPRGGPDGGNGGWGGSIFLKATRDKTSLLDFKYRPKFEADRGEHGMGSDMDGRGGEDLYISVPMGTMVFNDETGELIEDLIHDDQLLLVAEGGRGGRGNRTFKSSTNRAPRVATPGKLGETLTLRLELRVLADIGLIGLPNAGKSSFLRVISRATPRVADYPFTTLEPHLGVVENKGASFVVADLPGLIEGAAEGAGLGHKFLRHVSRNRILLHLVDISAPPDDILKNVKVIREELRQYDPQLLERPELLVFTKCDLLDSKALAETLKTLSGLGLEGFAISSQTGLGMETLLDELSQRTAEYKKLEREAQELEQAEQTESPQSPSAGLEASI